MKRKRTNRRTPEERALSAERYAALEERIRLAEAELAAKGSPLVALDRQERLAYVLKQHELERSAKQRGSSA